MEHFKAAAIAADSKNMDPVLKYCAVGRQLGYAMYLSLDAVTYVSGHLRSVWGRRKDVAGANSRAQLDAAGIRPLTSAKRLQQEAYRAWFAGITCNAIAGLYTLWQLRQREQNIDKNEGEGVVESKKILKSVAWGDPRGSIVDADDDNRERNTTNLQLISDLCDLTIPSTALGYTNLDDGIVGLAGTVSSLIGVWSTWKKTA